MNFSSQVLPEAVIVSMKNKNMWNVNCPVPFARLRLLNLAYYDFNGNICQGEMVVHEKISTSILSIFRELIKSKFPIEKIKLIDHYNGNDELSMRENNSSCFNHRLIAGSDLISMHSYGLAVDINPVQNPCILVSQSDKPIEIHPFEGKNYLNRHNQRPGMLEAIVPLFTNYGFDWGGYWNEPIDYHHFQIKRKNLQDFL